MENKKYWIVGIAVVLLGLFSVVLVQSDLFKGQIKRFQEDPDERLTAAMKKIEEFVVPANAHWPIESTKETGFRVLDKPHMDNVVFSTEKGYGKFRMLFADFELLQSGKYLKIKDKSEAQNTEIFSRCASFYKSDAEKETKCFEVNDENVDFSVGGLPAGDYEVKLLIEDKEGRFDDAVKIFTVEEEAQQELLNLPEPEPDPSIELVCSATLQDDKQTVQMNNDSVYLPNDDAQWEWQWTLGYDNQAGSPMKIQEKAPAQLYPVKEQDMTYKIALKAKHKTSDLEAQKNCGEVTIPGVAQPPAVVPVITPDFDIQVNNYNATGINVDLTNSSTIDNLSAVQKVTYVWSFDNGDPDYTETVDLVANSDAAWGNYSHHFNYPPGGGLEADYGPVSHNITLKVTLNNDESTTKEVSKPYEITKPIKAKLQCRRVGQLTNEGKVKITFTDYSEPTDKVKNVSLIFSEGTPSISTDTPSTLKSQSYVINDTTKPFTYTATHATDAMDTITAVVDELCPGNPVQSLGAQAPQAPAQNPSANPLLQDILDQQNAGIMKGDKFGLDAGAVKKFDFGGSLMNNVFNYLAADVGAAEDVAEWQKFTAKPGSTVYFEASCKTGEKKLSIEPKQGLKVYLDIAKNEQSCIQKAVVEEEVVEEAPPAPQCSDLIDNEEDGKTDFPQDPGCESAEDNDETDPQLPPPPVLTQCSDAEDNDADGKEDFPQDPGCESAEDNDETDPQLPPPPVPKQCADALDNDSDGKIDHPQDPGCDSQEDDNETDTPVTVVTTTSSSGPTPQCSDGQDNDDDGYSDFGKDPGCDSPEDNNEFNKISKQEKQCSDGKDNDGDGLEDLDDPGCEDANDNDEKNKEEVVKKGATKLPKCLKYVSPKTFVDLDFDNEDLEDVIEDQSSIAYDGDYEDFQGKAIFVGYTEGSKRYFKGDQPIRRDEVVKILEISTCYPDYLLSKKKFNEKKVGFNDPEFKYPAYWAKNFVYIAANSGIVDKKKTKFNPGKNVTRAEFLKMLMTMYSDTTGKKIAECTSKKTAFVDVQKDDWFCKYAKAAYDMDIAEGYKDKNDKLRLNPNHILTRTDAAALIHNYFVKLAGEDYAGDLKDYDEEDED